MERIWFKDKWVQDGLKKILKTRDGLSLGMTLSHTPNFDYINKKIFYLFIFNF